MIIADDGLYKAQKVIDSLRIGGCRNFKAQLAHKINVVNGRTPPEGIGQTSACTASTRLGVSGKFRTRMKVQPV